MAENTIEKIYNNYLSTTEANGDTKGNQAGIKSISYENGELLFVENDGDNITVNVGELSDDVLNGLNEKFGITISNSNNSSKTTSAATDSTDSTDKSSKTDKTKKLTDSEIISNDQAKISEKQSEISTLEAKSENIKKVVEQLSDEVEEALADAVKKQQKATEEEQKRIQNVIQREMDQYKTDKEDGKNVSLGTLRAKIQSGIKDEGFSNEMQDFVGNLVLTNSKIKQMDELLVELEKVSKKIGELDDEIQELNKDIKAHDPIGYELDGVTYEFVIDKDNSGDLTDAAEFLGAEKNFDEMKALDSDESGDVNKSELTAAGVMMLVKNSNTGEQTLKTLDEVFGEDEISIDTKNFNDLSAQNMKAENGQQLLGNFNITIGDNTLEGYSTLDSDEYLNENYTFSGKAADAEANTTANTTKGTGKYDDLLSANAAFVSEYSEKISEYEKQFDEILTDVEYSQDLITSIKDVGALIGALEAQEILDKWDKENTESTEEADTENSTQETTDEKEPEAADNQDDLEDELDDDKEEKK